MTLTVTFQLSDRDLEYFGQRLQEARNKAATMQVADVARAARRLVDSIRKSGAPDFVRERVEKLDLLARMVEDEEWRLQGGDQARVLHAMTYLADPRDLIPDHIPGLGFLDDAIMVELVCQGLRHEIEAYTDFCKYRVAEEQRRGKGDPPANREAWLATRRTQLHERMRRRRAALWDSRLGRRLF